MPAHMNVKPRPGTAARQRRARKAEQERVMRAAKLAAKEKKCSN